MPDSNCFGTRFGEIPISCNEQIIPSERSPRNFALLIFIPPGKRPPTVATMTLCPASTFGAPQTICTGASSPISTWHKLNLSASGWGALD